MIIQGCKKSHLVEDGYCNDETNKIQCGFDGGDCCYACVNKAFCKDCLCLTGTFEEEINTLLGDGYCNDETNNGACNYDAGDCCGIVNTDFCSECNCYLNISCASGSPPPTVGDGYCNDETNIKECLFDGLDCCGFDHDDDGYYDHYDGGDYYDYEYDSVADTSFCTECICHGMFLQLSFINEWKNDFF